MNKINTTKQILRKTDNPSIANNFHRQKEIAKKLRTLTAQQLRAIDISLALAIDQAINTII